MIICICGKSCSGKSTLSMKIASIFDNSVYVDIDKIGHSVLNIKKVQNELINNFGKEIITNNIVNRKKLGSIVFNSKTEMEKLTDITWKYMEKEIDKIIEENQDKMIILDYLLLPKTKYFKISNLRILLDIPYHIRKERALMRDKITSEEFDLREKNSMEYNINDFNYVLKNTDILNNNIDIKIKNYIKSMMSSHI